MAAMYSVGQRVTNTEVLGSKGWFSLGADIEPGSIGRVMEVEEQLPGGASCLVEFENGKECWADQDVLEPA